MKLLEHNLIEIDYCRPIPGGLRIYLSGQILHSKPVGVWYKIDNTGNIIEKLEGSELTNYFHPEFKQEKIE